MTLTIISGAAPGVEQGAIEAAVNLALRWEGWASSTHLTALPAVYRTGLRPTSATAPGMLRRLNCQDADGALVFSTSMVLVGVAAFVDRATEQMGRAFLHVTLNPATFGTSKLLADDTAAKVQDWIRGLPSGRIYVTGPSSDDVPGIQGAVRDALIAILEPFAVDEVRETTRALGLLEQAIAVVDGDHDLDRALDRGEVLGPATSADLLELDAVPEPIDSAAPEATYLPGARPIGPTAETRPIRAPGAMPSPMDVCDAVRKHGLSAAGEAVMREFPEARRRYEASNAGTPHAFIPGAFARGERGGQLPEETCDLCGRDPRNTVHQPPAPGDQTA